MSRYTLTPDARHDLRSVREYYRARREPFAAPRIVAAVKKTCRQYAQMPELGDPRDDLGPGIRCDYAGAGVVYYRTVAEGNEVLRVLHSARDIRPDMFAPDTDT